MAPFDSFPPSTPALAPETKHDVFSLEGLIAWLEKQPGDETYPQGNIIDCMYCRYVSDVCGRPMRFYDATERLNATGLYLTHDIIALPKPHTYGAALSRAQSLLAQRGR